MHTSTDQLGNTITLATPPRRIVSLVPSQTEFLFDIGLDEEIVGITRFCIHPKDKVAGKEKIGGTKQFNFDKIHALKPDLIIGNKEENYKDGVEDLQKHYPVWMSDIYTLDDSLTMIQQLSVLLGKQAEGKALIERISTGFSDINRSAASTLPSVAYFIWRKPYMVAASNTFINEMLHRFGARNVFEGMERYPKLDAAREMATMVSATRAYEANIRAYNSLRAMTLKAFEIGK